MDVNKINAQGMKYTGGSKKISRAFSTFGQDSVSIGNSNENTAVSMPSMIDLFKASGAVWTHKWDENRFFSASMKIGKDGGIYTGSGGKLKKLDPDTGGVMWEADFGKYAKTIHSNVTEGKNGAIYFTTNDRRLHALDGKTGAKIWKFDMGTNAYEPAIAPDGAVFTRKKNDMCVLNPDKSVQFTFEMNDSRHQVRFIDNDGSSYVESDRGIFAIDGKGKEKWHVPGNKIERFPKAPDRLFTIADKWIPHPEHRGSRVLNNLVASRDPNTGEKKWERQFKHCQVQGIFEGLVFIREPRTLYALDADTGKTVWDSSNGDMRDIGHVAKDGALIVRGGGRVQALEPGTGLPRWTLKTDSGDGPLLATQRGRIVLNDKNMVYGLDPEDGKVKFKRKIKGEINSIALSEDESKIFVEDQSGGITALDFRTAHQKAADISNAPKEGSEKERNEVIIGDGYVEIGGVRLERRERD